jgi:predicted MFS family arabinose efflux permease
MILEFGSVTFLLVSLLMAFANYKIITKTSASKTLTITAIIGLATGLLLIIYYEYVNHIEQLYFIVLLYIILTIFAYIYSKLKLSRR